jgi:hypothetical protein
VGPAGSPLGNSVIHNSKHGSFKFWPCQEERILK